jgi:hypothetical protein
MGFVVCKTLRKVITKIKGSCEVMPSITLGLVMFSLKGLISHNKNLELKPFQILLDGFEYFTIYTY